MSCLVCSESDPEFPMEVLSIGILFCLMGWARVCVEFYRKSRTVIKDKNRIVNIFFSSYDV